MSDSVRADEDIRILILIVDDHRLVRDGIRAVISQETDMRIVGEAANGVDALDAARTTKPDVILMDVLMPVMDGMEATVLIRKELPSARILMLSHYDDEQHKERAIVAGASGFLGKDMIVRDLRSAIRTVAGGGLYF